ncbi:unnamed protein product, partial [Phaeothamnion confervicola]
MSGIGSLPAPALLAQHDFSPSWNPSQRPGTARVMLDGTPASSRAPGGVDTRRRNELLVEARRKRIAWVEEARGVGDDGDARANGAGNGGADCGRGGRSSGGSGGGSSARPEEQLVRALPSAAAFVEFLGTLAGDAEECGGGDLRAALRPHVLADVDVGDDQPIPVHRPGLAAYDLLLDKLRHPLAADLVKTIQQFMVTFREWASAAAVAAEAKNGSNGGGSSGHGSASGAGAAFGEAGRLDELAEDAALDATATGTGAHGELNVAVASTQPSSTGAATSNGAAALAASLHSFLRRIEAQMRESVLWRGETEEQWERTRDAIERLVLHKLYEPAFRLVEDSERDRRLAARLRSLAFITFEHLDIASHRGSGSGGGGAVDVDWSAPEAELRRIDAARCPGDKLACVLRCMRRLAMLLTATTRRSDGSLPGADEFLPALILLVKRANPPRLHSNLEFIQRFREPARLAVGENGYVLTQLLSAVSFLECADAAALTITPEAFEAGMAESKRRSVRDLDALRQEALRRQ